MKKIGLTVLLGMVPIYFLSAILLLAGSCGYAENSTPPPKPVVHKEDNNQSRDFKNKVHQVLQMSSGILDEQQADLPEMIKQGRIRVLTTYSYLTYFINEGRTFGYEYNMMEEFKKYLTRKYRPPVPLEFFYVPIPNHLLIPALKKGYGDIVAANMTILPEREKEIDFTVPYLGGINEVLITQKNNRNIGKLEEISGKNIHVREGSSYYYALEKINKRFARENLSPVKIHTIPGLVNTGEIIEMVNAGILEMTIADSYIATLAARLLPGIKVHEDVVFARNVSLGWLVRKNNPLLRQSLNGFIKTVKKGTLLGNIFFNRYFKNNPWAKNALKKEDISRFSRYAPLFKKYGDRYKIDWYLIAAQAFQESGLNPDARSHAGAIGLMQLLPSTAKDMGIQNLYVPENNIHAGIKYMRWIIDHYFNEKEISSDDRMRLALAAYNAGAGNIRKSRRETDNMGHDSTQWFGHCELGTLKMVGLEPVHYVRNINRYYLSFLLSEVVKDLKKEELETIEKESDVLFLPVTRDYHFFSTVNYYFRGWTIISLSI